MITKNSVEKFRNEIENSKKFSIRFYFLQSLNTSIWYISKIKSSQKFKFRLDSTNSLVRRAIHETFVTLQEKSKKDEKSDKKNQIDSNKKRIENSKIDFVCVKKIINLRIVII